MSRSDRTWSQLYTCRICGKVFKQQASFSNHIRLYDGPHACKPPKKSSGHPGYPPEFQALMDRNRAKENSPE